MMRLAIVLLVVFLLSTVSAVAQQSPEVPQGSYPRAGDSGYGGSGYGGSGYSGPGYGELGYGNSEYGGGETHEYDHRQRCERLKDRRRDIRERLDQTPSWDQDRQERLRHRLDEVRDRYRDEGCVRPERRDRCEQLRARWQDLYQQIQNTPVWEFGRQRELRRQLDETRAEYRRAGCEQR